MTRHDDASTYAGLLKRLGADTTKDLFRKLLEHALQDLVDAELAGEIGAGRHERTDTRADYLNGGRSRTLSTPVGDVELRIPRLRVESIFSSALDRVAGSRRRCGE